MVNKIYNLQLYVFAFVEQNAPKIHKIFTVIPSSER